MLINNLAFGAVINILFNVFSAADLVYGQEGNIFAAFLKLLIPVIAVLPGIAMYVLHQNGMFQKEMTDGSAIIKPDHAYPTLMNLLPPGSEGVAFAALLPPS